jgi:hypothetical protein
VWASHSALVSTRPTACACQSDLLSSDAGRGTGSAPHARRAADPAARSKARRGHASFQLPNRRITVTRDGWFAPARSHSSVVGIRRCWRCHSSIA